VAPRSQRHLELLAKQEILQDQVVPTADGCASSTDDQRKKLKHRRRIAVQPSPLLGLTFALRQPMADRRIHRQDCRYPPVGVAVTADTIRRRLVDLQPSHLRLYRADLAEHTA
jgi:hypothetical protein